MLPHLFGPLITHPWFNFGIIAELVLSIFLFCLGMLQLLTVPGLWMGKSYSYKLALILPILMLVGNGFSAGLYVTAPAELGLGYSLGLAIFSVVMSLVWTIVIREYLGKAHVKAFLGIVQLKPIISENQKPIVQEKQLLTKEEKLIDNKDMFYCRYCGVENSGDAVFCEKCGKKLK